MFKKTLLTAALALAATGAASADGFYAGLGLGASALHSQSTLNSLTGDDSTGENGNFGVLGGLFGGYNFNFANQLNLGLEAFVNADSAKFNESVNAVGYTGKLTYNYGLRVLPGYQITADTDLHLLAGVARGHFEGSSVNFSNSQNVNGWQLGLGSTTSVNTNFAVRGDVIYTGYKTQNLNFSNGDTGSFKANTLDGVISGEYKFG
jgi:outer membrane immunogenic protein